MGEVQLQNAGCKDGDGGDGYGSEGDGGNGGEGCPPPARPASRRTPNVPVGSLMGSGGLRIFIYLQLRHPYHLYLCVESNRSFYFTCDLQIAQSAALDSSVCVCPVLG